MEPKGLPRNSRKTVVLPKGVMVVFCFFFLLTEKNKNHFREHHRKPTAGRTGVKDVRMLPATTREILHENYLKLYPINYLKFFVKLLI